MQKILLNNVKKLSRQDSNSLYFYFASSREINEWDIKKSNNPIIHIDGVLNIQCSNLVELNSNVDSLSIEISEPLILSPFSQKVTEDQYLVIIKVWDLPRLIFDIFLNDDQLNCFIEVQGKSVSKRSIKVIKNTSLKKLIYNVFSNIVSNDSAILIQLLKEYLYEFLNINNIYYPKSVKDMVTVKESYVIHQVNTWFIILNYFKEQWECNRSIINAPNFSIEIEYQDWKGNFFSRENPFWDEINQGSRRSNYPSEESNKVIYKQWKELTKPSKI